MRVVAFVPIKLTNERLPNKNILPLGGKPLCCHLLDSLTTVEGLSEIYVFCSDPEIGRYLPKGVNLLLRDKSLDSFQTRHYDIVESFISQVDADVYVNAHVTNPFIPKRVFDEGIAEIVSRRHDCAYAVEEIREHLWLGGKPFNFTFEDPPRTQDLEPLYSEVGVFMYVKSVYTTTKTRYGKNPYFIKMDRIEALDINYRPDYDLAQAIVEIRAKSENF